MTPTAISILNDLAFEAATTWQSENWAMRKVFCFGFQNIAQMGERQNLFRHTDNAREVACARQLAPASLRPRAETREADAGNISQADVPAPRRLRYSASLGGSA